MVKATNTAKRKTKTKTKADAPHPQVEVATQDDSTVAKTAASLDQAKLSAKAAENVAPQADDLNKKESTDVQVKAKAVTAETTSKSVTPSKPSTEKKKVVPQKVVQRSPLAGKSGGEVLQMQEIVEQTLINLRGKTDDDAFMQAVQNSLGALPVVANTTTSINNGVIFWLGPDEWQVRFHSPPAAEVLSSLRQSLTNVHAAYNEISDYYTVIRIAGEQARDALAAACPLDLHKLQSGSCAQSHYAKAAVLLYQKDDTPTFDLQVRWSYAEYVWQYLCAATGDL
ncbi:MAG: sarcosine oxidase subunit gamma [Gammaproteobacteria bacterium WSBS_2016_MAG_OTU1]